MQKKNLSTQHPSQQCQHVQPAPAPHKTDSPDSTSDTLGDTLQRLTTGRHLSAQDVFQLQRQYGNQFVQRTLSKQRASESTTRQQAPTNGVQRLLITGPQLINIAGAPKKDSIFRAMSTKYKDVLAKLDAYHEYLTTKNVDPLGIAQQKRDLHELLDDLATSCATYQRAHGDEVDERYRQIEALQNNATLEKRDVNRVAKTAGEGGLGLHPTAWRDYMTGHEFGESGGLEVPDNPTTLEREPALEAKFKRVTDIFQKPTLTGTVAGQAPKNGLAMRSNLKGSPAVVYVEYYEKEAKEVKVKVSGYAPAASVTVSDFTHEKIGNDVPIFNGKPSIEDVQQQSIGDCYLMAAIGSLVATDPLYAYNMIRDNRDGTVTVRLFDTTQDPPRATYITLEKSLVSGDRRSGRATWVAFVEKAYAAMGVGASGAVSTSYAQMGSGGQSSFAFKVLTGKGTASQNVSTGGGEMARGGSNFWLQAPILKYKKYKKAKADGNLTAKTRDEFKMDQAFRILQDEDKAAALMEWISTPGNKYVGLFTTAHEAGTIESFNPILAEMERTTVLPPDIFGPVKAAIKQRYAGKMGTGIYTDAQTRTYTDIQNALAQGKLVATGTQNSFPGEKKTGLSAGEGVVRGLVSEHAYTIVGISEKSGLKYVKLRNPWGSYGSQYKGKNEETGELQPETDEETLRANKGTFELELTDFTDHYKDVYFGSTT